MSYGSKRRARKQIVAKRMLFTYSLKLFEYLELNCL